MSFIKDLFKPFFTKELKRLESCENELLECRNNYNELLNTCNDKKEVIVEIPIIPRDFENFEEMRIWFTKNQVDKLPYVKTSRDCDDFSILTQQDALKDGFIVNLELDMTGSYYGNGAAHMLCGCRIDNHYYIIEPQHPGCSVIYDTRLD